MRMDDNGQMIFGDLGGLKLPDICLTGEEKPRKNLTQETCSYRGSNPGLLRDKRTCYHLLQDVIHDKILDRDKQEWQKKNSKEKTLIIDHKADNHLEYIKYKHFSFEMWDGLVSVFERKSLMSHI